jgi:Zn finger protein HypA/HybF involved in hydrogenase expression
MHDLLLAKKILDQVLSCARSHGLKSVTKIVIEIGKIEEHDEEISASNLKFNLSSLVAGTQAARVKIIIQKTSRPNYLKIREIQGQK